VLPGFESEVGFDGLVLLVGEGGRGISVALFSEQDALGATDEQAAGFRSEASDRGYQVNLLGTFENGATDAISRIREAMGAAGVTIASAEEFSVRIAQLPG
jgi:hypothetical protein